MTLGAEDRMAVMELIALHGHLVDDGELDRLDELFTADVVYDASDLGHGSMHGLEALRDTARSMGGHGPVSHHVTNIVLTEAGEGRVHARSKGFGIKADGTSGSVSYEDVIVRGGTGWRISRRKVAVRGTPSGTQKRSG
ncbi:nuclear transport factor 2 family protein [Streptomyces sp. NBC_01217]|uniref:nuclear transport factor 2 family protein n=1 Tax=Streptomyces sp. NBC_01217 TaxID=2903779 RepID=UPI002E166D36|nr:nuclear transport factor 2 family protein [Streptomyces sp. NBC_01217]